MKQFLAPLIFLVSLITGTLQGQPQLKTWYMNYYQVSFSQGAPPQFSSLPFYHTSNMGAVPNRFANVANGIHDINGNLVFYTVWDNNNPTSTGYRHQVYNSNGNLIGNISVEADAWELSIVPYGSVNPDKYLIIYPAQRGAGATRYLDYVIVDMTANGGQGVMSPGYEIVAAGAGSPTQVSAVGSLLMDGTRYLYLSAQKHILKYVIDVDMDQMGAPDQVISPAANATVYSFSQNLYLSELELSHDGSKLALGETWENDVHVLNLDANGDFVSIQSFSIGSTMAFNEYITGVEFDAMGDKLFVNLSRPNNCPPATDEGVYVIDLMGGTVSAAPIASTGDYSRSNLELAHDGYLYAGAYFKDDQENRLGRIDPMSETLMAEYVLPDLLPYVGDYRGYSCNSGYPGFFTLPDQIDGDLVVSSSDLLLVQDLKVFPNPAREEIILSLPSELMENQQRLTIYDGLGRVVWYQVFDHQREQIHASVAHLPSGIYTVVVSNGRMYGRSKFIKN